MRVLVVDDDAGVRQVLRLSLSGHSVLEAADGRSALALLARADVDVVLLDLMMPDLDGFSVLRRLRADERLRDLPVVLLTARGSERDHETAFRSGADAYLTKPFDLDVVEERLVSVVATSPAGRRAEREEAAGQAHLLRALEQSFPA